MKKLLIAITVTIMSLVSTVNASECWGSYIDKAVKRQTAVNIAGVLGFTGTVIGSAAVTVATAGIGGAVILPVLAVSYVATSGSALGMALVAKNNKNVYYNLIDTFEAARENKTTKFSQRLLESVAQKSSIPYDETFVAQANQLLVTGYDDGTFCPIVRAKRNGTIKTKPYSKKQIIRYLTNKLVKTN